MYIVNDQIANRQANLFCTLNKQTNTLEKQASRGRLFSLLIRKAQKTA